MERATSHKNSFIGISHSSFLEAGEEFFRKKKLVVKSRKSLKQLEKYINTFRENRRDPAMIFIEQIRGEFKKLLKKDFLKSELKKLKSDMQSMTLYKRLPEPTQKHLSQLEQHFDAVLKKINHTQNQIDKEFNNALGMLRTRRTEATGHIKDLRKMAINQKNTIEKTVRKKIKTVTAAGSKKKTKKRKKVTKAAARKTTTKTAKKKTTKKKTGKKVAKKASRSKKKR